MFPHKTMMPHKKILYDFSGLLVQGCVGNEISTLLKELAG
jgi:hypothetical protein